MNYPAKIIIGENQNNVCHENANPDPFILRQGNKYYCYTSAYYGVKILESEDLKSFTENGYVYSGIEEKSFWAPAVIQWKDKYYLYYSSLKKEETDDHKHYLRVAVSDNPKGPFKYLNTLTDYFAIDPHVVSSNGRYFVFYAANIEQNEENGRIGTTIWVDELIAPDVMAGRNRTVLLPTIDEEIFARNRFGDGKDWHTLEGPFYLSDGVHSWLMYSGNAYTSPDYFIGYAEAEYKEDLCELQFKKMPSSSVYQPLVHAGNGITGTGHNSVTQGLDHLTSVIVYHGRVSGGKTDGNQDDRMIFTDYIWRENNRLCTEAPSETGIGELKRPDIHFLDGKAFQMCEKNVDGEKKLSGKYELKLPKDQDLYIEICGSSFGNGVSIKEVKSKKTFLELKGKYHQQAGILFSKGKMYVRYEEEWKTPMIYKMPESLLVDIEEEASLFYIDGTLM